MKNPRWLFLLACVLLILPACKGGEEHPKSSSAGRVVRTRLYVASPVEVLLFRELPATVEARQRAVLSSKVSGFVTEVRVKEGDRIRAGEVLLRVDDRDLRARIRALSSAVQALRRELVAISAREAYARAEFQRFRKLFAAQAATAEEYEARKSEYQALAAQREALEARIRETQARLSEVRTLLRYTVLRAPFSGDVVRKYVDPGTFVGPGQPLLEVENQEAGYRLVCHPGEALFGRIHSGMKAWVFIPGRDLRLTLRVSQVVRDVDPQTRTFTVKFDLPKEVRLPSGTYGRVFLPVGREKTLLVPREALVDRGGFKALFVVNPQGLVYLRVVRIGKTYWRLGKQWVPVCEGPKCRGYVEVLSGLEPGERVVAHPPLGLKEGDRVEE